jgi:molecular chaperone HtpG
MLGWMWFGRTSFKAAIKEEEISRGLRLRKENIQIGHDGTLRDMFTREASKRGNNYFIGEVFASSKDLIPNSQRSYFKENPTRISFEYLIKEFCNETLYRIYYEGSDINSSIKKIASFNEKTAEFNEKVKKGGFLTEEEQEREEQELRKKAIEAEKAKNNLERKKEAGRSKLTVEIIERRTSEIQPIAKNNTFMTTPDAIKPKPQDVVEAENDAKPYKPKQKFLVDSMFPRANKNERKLLSDTLDKIFTIVQKTTDKKTSEKIITAIKDELK